MAEAAYAPELSLGSLSNEIGELGLQRHIEDLDTHGYTVIPPAYEFRTHAISVLQQPIKNRTGIPAGFPTRTEGGVGQTGGFRRISRVATLLGVAAKPTTAEPRLTK